jgi:hypothetical protein
VKQDLVQTLTLLSQIAIQNVLLGNLLVDSREMLVQMQLLVIILLPEIMHRKRKRKKELCVKN